jgi:Asp/Glu/hydantoin racemase
LPNNNTIHGFETSSDITQFLKSQWAGLFQRFLHEQIRVKELNVIKGIENTAKTLNQLVTFLTEEKRDKDNAINEILLSNHPAMEQIKELLKIPCRVFFTTKDEFIDLITARGFREK